MKVIHGIEGDVNKIKIAPWKIKQPNLEVLKYIKGGKYPEAEVEKYVYSGIERQSREVLQYVRIQISVTHDVTWDNRYTTLRGQWMKKLEKRLKLCHSDCVDPVCFGWLVRSICQIALTNNLC